MKIHEILRESIDTDEDIQMVHQFIEWATAYLGISGELPNFVFSKNNPKNEDKPHTGAYDPGTNKLWVYIGERNMVDILRTVAHELTHTRQRELGMIKPNDSYPGSPIEVLADAMAGKMMKIYGKRHPEIYQ